MHGICELSRRALLAAGAGLLASSPVLAASEALLGRKLMFEVWRNGRQIGLHTVQAQGRSGDLDVAIEAQIKIDLGPVPVFRYRHQARETWRQGRLTAFRSETQGNLSHNRVLGERTDAGFAITTGGRSRIAPEGVHPLTHWNPAVLDGPLFNPQTGASIHEAVVRSEAQTCRLPDGREAAATRFALTGSAQITDWYDTDQAWLALQARGPDGSNIDYHRIS